jgi:hypothetical protein
MKAFAAACAILMLMGFYCAAQDNLSASTDQDASQSVAAAAKVSRARVQLKQAKEDDIRKLMEVTGAPEIAIQTMDGAEKNMRSLISDSLPAGDYREKLVDLFFEKFHSKRDAKQLAGLIIPIYDKYYSDDEIKQLIQLYQTPLGQKMLSVLPKVAAESQAAGMKWGEQIGRDSMMEVLAEHPEMARAIQEAKRTVPAQ